MFSVQLGINRLLLMVQNWTHSSKSLVVLTIFIFAAIPLTVFGIFNIRNFSSDAAGNKLTNFSPSGVSTNQTPLFTWVCNCKENTYRLELREKDSNFSKGSWLKDIKSTSVVTSSYYSSGWTSFNYPVAPSSLKTGVKYFWKVSCLDSNCSETDPISFTIKNTDSQKPTTPNGLKIINISESSFTLTWNKSSDNVGVVSYLVIESSTHLTPTNHKVFDNFYVKNSYVGSETYSFTLAAVDSAGNNSKYSEKLTFKTADKDTDKDGFLDSKELYYGTDINNACKGKLSWPPDMNDDGVVDAKDLAIVKKNINSPKLSSSARYDLNQNGIVDNADLAVLQNYLNKNC